MFLFLTIAIVIGSQQLIGGPNNDKYPSSASLESSLSVPILTLLNEFIDFMHSYLNQTNIALLKIEHTEFESFGEDKQYQKTVYLRSYYSNEPIQAVHTELIHIFYLNVTSLDLSFIDYQHKTNFIVHVDLAQSAMDRWAPISFISSSHLPSLTNIQTDTIKDRQGNNIRIMSMNLWNYNYWIKRLDLIDEILQKYKPDIIGLQELRIRSKYMIDDLYPYEDPHLLHSFQIYDIITLLSYFSESNGKYQWYSSPAMFFKESTPEQYPEHIGHDINTPSRFKVTFI